MTVFLIFVFLAMLVVFAFACGIVTNWIHVAEKKWRMFIVGIFCLLGIAIPLFFLGMILWKQLQVIDAFL